MNTIYRKDSPVLVDSLHADFDKNQWTVQLTDRLATVGGGLWLCVPVVDEAEAALIERAITEMRTAPPVKRGRPARVVNPLAVPPGVKPVKITGPQPGDLDYDDSQATSHSEPT